MWITKLFKYINGMPCIVCGKIDEEVKKMALLPRVYCTRNEAFTYFHMKCGMKVLERPADYQIKIRRYITTAIETHYDEVERIKIAKKLKEEEKTKIEHKCEHLVGKILTDDTFDDNVKSYLKTIRSRRLEWKQ